MTQKIQLHGLCCPPQAPLQILPQTALCPFPSHALLLCQHSLSWHSQHLHDPALHLVQIPQWVATSEADCGVKTAFHLPLTCFLRTLQWYYCLTVVMLSHLAASQITPCNTALSCVMNKSLFHHGSSCTFSLNSQNHRIFPIQISPKNLCLPSTYKLKIIIKALGYPFLWVSQCPWLTALTENVLHTKNMSPLSILRNKWARKKSFVQFQFPSSSVPSVVAA